MSDDIHSGHRTRMKRRYLDQGLEGFSDHEALELLLYYAIPRADVNPLAHRLMERFGSFRGVLDAEVAELTEVEGVGESTAMLMRLIRDMNRRYLLDRQEKRTLLADSASAGRFFLPYFLGLREERVYAAFLDDELRLIHCRMLFEGGINYAPLSVRKLVETALREKATGVILAHNHPAGQAIPSMEDREATLHIRSALEAVQIRLHDHIIVAGEEFTSMEECGHFRR